MIPHADPFDASEDAVAVEPALADFPGAAEIIAAAASPPAASAAFAPFDDEPDAAVDDGPLSSLPALFGADADAFIGGAMAPRIAIHIYCERPETVEIAERAAADRRLARATTVIRTGGLAAALGAYDSSITPPLVIVESSEPAETLLAGLDRLAEACDAGTKVVVIGRTNDIALYRALMARGGQRVSGAAFRAAAADQGDHRPLLRPRHRLLRPHGGLRRRQGRGGSLDPGAQLRLGDQRARAVADLRGRLRPGVRHRRPRLQPGSSAGPARRPGPARPCRLHASGPHGRALHRAAEPVRRPRQPGRGLGDQRRRL